MRYFVKAEFVEVGALFPLKDFVPMVENLVIPSQLVPLKFPSSELFNILIEVK